MFALTCMFWVGNLAMACSEDNKVWLFNLATAMMLTVIMVHKVV